MSPNTMNEIAKLALTVLSFGGGQDSTTLLEKLIFDPIFRVEQAPGRLLVVMSDTGNEHPSTYAHVLAVMELCKKHAVEFVLLSGDECKTAKALGVSVIEAADLGVVTGYHSDSWSSLTHQWELKSSVGSFAFPKSCTDNLKIQPIYRFLEQWIGKEYGFKASGKKANGDWIGKPALRAYAEKFGKVRMIIGIAAGEEKRVAKAAKTNRMKWLVDCVERVYPLIGLGLDRKGCQEYIESMKPRSGIEVPSPSNCIFCPFLSAHELLWLSRRLPARFEEWVVFEDRKLKANEGKLDKKTGEPIKNVGVFKTGANLREALAAAEKEFGHMSDDALDFYKMSHGHCVQSTY